MNLDREKSELRGSVQTVKTQTFEFTRGEPNPAEHLWYIRTESFDNQGHILETTFYNAQHPEYSSKETFLYDSPGKLAERFLFSLNGDPGCKTTYVYDPEGRLLEESSFRPDGVPIDKRVFAYHSNGKKAEERFFNYVEQRPGTSFGYCIDEYDHSFSADGARQIKTVYDLEGNASELQFLSEDGKLLSKVIFTTDAAGRITKDAQYAGEKFPVDIPEGVELPSEIAEVFAGETALMQSELIYDEQGRKIEDRMYFGNLLLMRRVFTYDAKGELIEDTTYEADGTLQSQARFEWEYDDEGNWTKELVWSWNKEKGEFEPSLASRREITYFR